MTNKMYPKDFFGAAKILLRPAHLQKKLALNNQLLNRLSPLQNGAHPDSKNIPG